jgi:hypothetical protein
MDNNVLRLEVVMDETGGGGILRGRVRQALGPRCGLRDECGRFGYRLNDLHQRVE